ncbi:serine hydrolase domain-containing protein [Ekhidna sp.]|uniref:serine hydrolase domain-containing protein n=1 Tax=Ekhidna sp. TaxID=2608089 RepID=UPI003CCBDA57
MKKLLILAGLSSLAWLIYALFQPIIDWNFGWNQMPDSIQKQTFTGTEDPMYYDAIHASKLHLDSIVQISESPSLSIAVMIQGKMAFTYVLGFQDLEKLIPADTSTKYRVGSVSKALSSLGLAKMVEDETLNLDSSIQYYTELFQDKPDISIRQLASHQSGIRNYGACFCFPVWEYYRNAEFESVEASLGQFEKDDLLFEPGASFSYSSYNYTALSYAMEKASARNFLSYMGEYVFDPLQMENTAADKSESTNKAIPYETNDGEYKEAFQVNLSNKWAGGGFISTPSDLVRAGNALLDSSFLDQSTIEELITPQRLNDNTINEQNYALGWRHDFSERYFGGKTKVEIIHHGGMAVGGMALLAVYPEYNLVFAITMNKSGQRGRFELFDYMRPIVDLFLRREIQVELD